MKKVSVIAPLVVLSCLGASAALAAGSAEKGESKATACIACHGAQGNSANPEWPVLAGQHEQYIHKQLQAFKSGARKNPLMSPPASACIAAVIRRPAHPRAPRVTARPVPAIRRLPTRRCAVSTRRTSPLSCVPIALAPARPTRIR
jgi:cytochrome c553